MYVELLVENVDSYRVLHAWRIDWESTRIGDPSNPLSKGIPDPYYIHLKTRFYSPQHFQVPVIGFYPLYFFPPPIRPKDPYIDTTL